MKRPITIIAYASDPMYLPYHKNYEGIAVVINPFVPPGKVYHMPRSSFIGPLIEETW